MLLLQLLVQGCTLCSRCCWSFLDNNDIPTRSHPIHLMATLTAAAAAAAPASGVLLLLLLLLLLHGSAYRRRRRCCCCCSFLDHNSIPARTHPNPLDRNSQQVLTALHIRLQQCSSSSSSSRKRSGG
jgi:hypothetical protein